MVAVPAALVSVGVPEITPAVLIEIPAGSPVALNVYAPTPPDAPRVTLIGVIAAPTVDTGILNAGSWVKARGTIGIVTAPYETEIVAVAAKLSVTVTVADPAAFGAIGVPEITPVVGLMLIPAGNPVALNVYGVVPPTAPPDTSTGVIAVPTVDAGILNVPLNARGPVTVKFMV